MKEAAFRKEKEREEASQKNQKAAFRAKMWGGGGHKNELQRNVRTRPPSLGGIELIMATDTTKIPLNRCEVFFSKIKNFSSC